MASRLLNQATTYFGDDGAPVAGGTLYFYETGTTTPKNVFGEKALTTNLGATQLLDSAGRQVNDIWLNGAYTVVLRDALGAQVWSRDNVEAPSLLPSAVGGTNKVVSSDGSGYVLRDVSEVPSFAAADGGDTLQIVGGLPTWRAPQPVTNYGGAQLESPLLLNHMDKAQSIAATATTTINYALGAIVQLSQDVSITSLVFSNFGAANKWARMLIIRTKDNSGTARTIAWGSVKWAGGAAPTLSSTANAVDIIELWSNGTAVYGFSRGLAMA